MQYQNQLQQHSIVGQVANYMEMFSEIYSNESIDNNEKSKPLDENDSNVTAIPQEETQLFNNKDDVIPMSKASISSSFVFTKSQLCNYLPRCLCMSLESNHEHLSLAFDRFFKVFFTDLDVMEYGGILLFKISDWMISSFQGLFKELKITHKTDISVYQKTFTASLDAFAKCFFDIVKNGFGCESEDPLLSFGSITCIINLLVFVLANSIPIPLVFSFTQLSRVDVQNNLTAYDFWFFHAKYFEKYHATEDWVFSFCHRFLTSSPYCKPSIFSYLRTSYKMKLLDNTKENCGDITIPHFIVSNLMVQTLQNNSTSGDKLTLTRTNSSSNTMLDSSKSQVPSKKSPGTVTFSDKIKCSNWLWKTYEQLFMCCNSQKTYMNDGRISGGKTGQLLVRFKPFTKGEHFSPYKNYAVHRWLYKNMEIEKKGGFKKVRETLQSSDLLVDLKTTFSTRMNNYYSAFRSLISSLWFRIPICIRRTIMISETEKIRLKHFDRVKIVNFFYVCIFKPLSIVQVTETNTESLPSTMLQQSHSEISSAQSSKAKYTGCIFSPEHMTHLLITFLKEIASISTEYESRHFDEIKYIFDNNLLKDDELTSKNILFPNCSTIADLRLDGETKQFATSSTSLMTCPFSIKNKDKMYKNMDEETRLFVSHPKCLVKDIEDLGLSSKSELRREFYATDIEDIGSKSLNMAVIKKKISSTYYSSDNMESVCTSCTELCKNNNAAHGGDGKSKQLYMYFQNPADKFLKSIYKGDTKDL